MTVKLYVTEYNTIGYGAASAPSPMAMEPALTDQVVTATTSTASTAFNAATKFIRMLPDTLVYVKFGASPTATATSQRLTANVEYWRAVVPGQKVAVYDGSS